ncbi:uncharacterized protein LOC133182471 [Saccostrea echinata]|uniref:uncharacterized protein LOC133182471 n=1 Tax=Saccostrea echinata TaxID=191078 RepID=UPI002A837B89|nr:uncharacterized protein LOC133182471 [Saccostrea echinata]
MSPEEISPSQISGRSRITTHRSTLLSSSFSTVRDGLTSREKSSLSVESLSRTKIKSQCSNRPAVQREVMDRNAKMHKREQMASRRTKKLLRVAKIRLDGQLKALNKHFLRESREIERETTFIEDQVKKMEEEDNQVTRLPLETQNRKSPELPVLPRPRFLGCSTPSKSDLSMGGRGECLYCNDSRCHYFPCYLPVTYHAIGITEREKSFSVLRNYDTLLSRCSKVRPPSRKSVFDEQDELPKLSPHARISIHDRERGLQQLVKEMKDRNRKRKPRDWATNYGEPLPRRIVLKSVTHVSESLLEIN